MGYDPTPVSGHRHWEKLVGPLLALALAQPVPSQTIVASQVSEASSEFGHPTYSDFTPPYCDPDNFAEKAAQVVFPNSSDFGRGIPASEARWIFGLTDSNGESLSDGQFFRWLWQTVGRHNFRIIGPGIASNELTVAIDPPDPTQEHTVYFGRLMPITESCRDGAAERSKRALYLEGVGYVFDSLSCPTGSVCADVPVLNLEASVSANRGAGWQQGGYLETVGSVVRHRIYPIRSQDFVWPQILLVSGGGSYVSTLHFGGGLDSSQYQGTPGLDGVRRATVGSGAQSFQVSAEYWHPAEKRWKWAHWTRPEKHSRDSDQNYVGQFGIADFFNSSNPELFVKANDLCAFTGGVHAGVAAATTLDLSIVVKVKGGESLHLAAPRGNGFAAYTGGFDLCGDQ